MSTETEKKEVVFRSVEEMKAYFAPSLEPPDYTGKSEDYIRGAESARKMLLAEKQRKEEEEERKRNLLKKYLRKS